MNDPLFLAMVEIGGTCALLSAGIMFMFPGAPPVTRLARISSASLFAGGALYCVGRIVTDLLGLPWIG